MLKAIAENSRVATEPSSHKFRFALPFRIGVALLAVGSAPLLTIGLISKLGLTEDPNPNPVGAGMFFAITCYPSIALILYGAWKSWRQ
ncbi:MAG TPA: hypothetical protein DDW52_05045 [Planctomycetaceae bacterium]|nr:hypothetical protein [Planctomycetaceae bacterium]